MENNFIVKMFDYFLDAKSIYFLLEFINGGEMYVWEYQACMGVPSMYVEFVSLS